MLVGRTNDDFIIAVADRSYGVAQTGTSRLFRPLFCDAPIDVEGCRLGLSIATAVDKRHALSMGSRIGNLRETGLIRP